MSQTTFTWTPQNQEAWERPGGVSEAQQQGLGGGIYKLDGILKYVRLGQRRLKLLTCYKYLRSVNINKERKKIVMVIK